MFSDKDINKKKGMIILDNNNIKKNLLNNKEAWRYQKEFFPSKEMVEKQKQYITPQYPAGKWKCPFYRIVSIIKRLPRNLLHNHLNHYRMD